jgi:pseudouridine-5'-phosphate glycosidase
MAKYSTNTPSHPLSFSDEVAAAFEQSQPVLALESTIITHGMPFPKNLETALSVQQSVRDAGAVPATIAIMKGKLKVGLEDGEIEELARLGQGATKCSRRDIPFLVSNGGTGATTVAATMIIAELAGIRVFATGGIGGVHRGAETSMDISADLQELAKTSVAVVCAGPKSILDIGLTLEYLETHGVPVLGYQTDDLPAFFIRSSGFGVDYRIDSPAGIAAALKIKWSLGLEGGAVIANPIPEESAMDSELIDQFISQANAEAVEKGALIHNNARLGAEIAVAMSGQPKG